MITPELWEALRQLNHDEKLRVLKFLEDRIAKDQEQSEKFERLARKLLRDRSRVFEELAKG